MKKTSIFNRFLSIILVLTLVLSGVSLDFSVKDSNTITVNADGNNHGSVSNGNFSGKGSGTYNGCGWRISICANTSSDNSSIIDQSKLINNKVENPHSGYGYFGPKSNVFKYMHTMYKMKGKKVLLSVYVTSFTGDLGGVASDSDGNRYKDFYNAKHGGIVYKNIKNIFKGLTDTSGFTADIVKNGTMNTKQCDEFLSNGGAFDKYIAQNKEKAVQEFLDACNSVDNFNIADEQGYYFVFEPVIIYDNVAMSYQDCQGDPKGNSWSFAFNNSINCSSTSPNQYLSSSNSGTAALIRGMRDNYFWFRDTNNSFTDDSYLEKKFKGYKSKYPAGNVCLSQKGTCQGGYSLFGVPDHNGAHVGASYTLLYDGTALDSNKDITVISSANMVDDKNAGSIYADLGSTLNAKSKDSVVSSWGSTVKNPFNTKKMGDKVVEVSGSSDWDSLKDYTNVASGIQTIDFDNVSTQTVYLSNVINAKSLAEDISKIQLESKVTNVTGGSYNYGINYTLKLKDGGINYNILTKNVANRLANKHPAFINNSAKVSVNADQYEGSISNIVTNFALKGLTVGEDLKSLTPDKFKTNGSKSTMAVSVNLMAKRKLAKSYISFATLDRDTGEVDYIKNWTDSYDISGNASFRDIIEGDSLFIVMANNGNYSFEKDPKGEEIFSRLDGDCLSTEDLKACAEQVGAKVVGKGSLRYNQYINVGCNTDFSGYSILVVNLRGTVAKKSKADLRDYELNYIYPSMLLDENGNVNYAQLYDNESYKKTGTETVGCNTSGKHTSHFEEHSADKTVKATSNYTGNIINKNLKLGTNKNILQFDDYTGGIFTTEKKARTGYTFRDNLTNVKFSLAINLIRSSFGDKRVVSSISKQTIDKNYAKENLELTYGNKPSSNVAKASSVRSSSATVGNKLKDTFEWQVKFTITDTPFLNMLEEGFIYCGGHRYWCGGYYCGGHTRWCNPSAFHWQLVKPTKTPGSTYGDKVKYIVEEKAQKYESAQINTAENKPHTIQQSKQVSSSGKGGNSSITNTYKIMCTISSNFALGFYPEVRMRAYSSTGETIRGSFYKEDTIGRVASGAITPHTVLTMGEFKRKVKPSTLCAIKLVAPANNVVSGKTVSDSIATGSNANKVSGGLPVVYAGGNLSLTVKPTFKLNMYGYSLDLIEKTDNNLVGNGGYTSVVADGSSIKTDWGNDNTYNPLSEFNQWIKSTLNKLGVDTTLVVKGDGVNKTYNNFSSSIGNIGNNTASVDGVFSIKVKKGTIVTDDGGYKALMNQIKYDYDLKSTSEAEALFKSSDIYQSIARAVEDSNDGFNKSTKSKAIDANREHWYDEEVKTFVIRRFKKENIEIKNILVNDKLDYGAAPTASKTTSSNKGYKKATAKWYLTLYFKQSPDGFSSGTKVYNPSNYSGLGTANNAGTVLVNELYVNGADFIVPSSSTNDMGN